MEPRRGRSAIPVQFWSSTTPRIVHDRTTRTPNHTVFISVFISTTRSPCSPVANMGSISGAVSDNSTTVVKTSVNRPSVFVLQSEPLTGCDLSRCQKFSSALSAKKNGFICVSIVCHPFWAVTHPLSHWTYNTRIQGSHVSTFTLV